MKIKATLAAASIAMALSLSAHAAPLTEKAAKDIVQPFYSYLSNPGSKAAAEKARAAFDPNWHSYYDNHGYKGLDQTIKGIAGFAKAVPNLNWEIKDVKVAGDTIIVRGKATGTPAGRILWRATQRQKFPGYVDRHAYR